ncbi:AAA family ATPase [Spirosoma aureum]|uniref:AAA family ATPase n=1 Tax=Spirosoma aureum TaxID=2692134 RepID=A0A6G9AXF3_9BACT|nr:AAA family ATPase [Spirosoma aureum]QIP16975.1 AAA family ATPase [Spirosoma aureum]
MDTLSTLLYESDETLIFREKGPNGTQIRKVLRATTPDPDQILQFTNEFEYTKDLRISGVRRSLALHKENQQYSLLLEYIDGATLGEAFVGKNQPLDTVLSLFITVSGILGQLHNRNIIHKDIHDNNILWIEKTKSPVVIDFGIANRIDLLSTNLGNPERIKGRLTHMSPEQTGRVNRKVDSRSDLYSLGVTMYQVLTGLLPFQATDPLELVHAHIAWPIPNATSANPAIPAIVSEIVTQLMAKNAEERYQSAFGLKVDLERCLAQYRETGQINPFPLKQRDFSGKFQIPQKLYGRAGEVETLLRAFDRVSRGSVELFLVAGYSGVGKTALIGEIYKPVTEKRGYFAGGKFDQYQRNIPYFAFKQALGEFCMLLLTERRETLSRWQQLIQESVGENGQVLTDMIPELTTLIGPQPHVPKLDPQEATNRFNLVFSKFMKAIARPEHPFILFLDDLQWADVASLNLIRLLITDVNHSCFLVIGAYRDNEVSAGHPLLKMLDTAQDESAVINAIVLDPLREEHLFQLIKESLLTDDSTVQELTKLVYAKTQGNAFFTLEFLKSLNQMGLVSFDANQLKWQIDFAGIRRRAITNNVIDLLVEKMGMLPETTQSFLKMAACIGGLFDMQLLAYLSGQDIPESLQNLWAAVEEGLISPVGENYQYADIIQHTESFRIQIEFSHDRIQQAAYSLMTSDEQAQLHLQIGRFLLQHQLHDEDHLFDLVNHLNAGAELLTEPAERARLTRLNLTASLKARQASAHLSAFTYVNLARRLAGDQSWTDDYGFALLLHKTAADLEYLNGNFSAAETLMHVCLEHVQTLSEKADVYFLLMQIQSNTTRYYEAIESARQGLKLLDFDFPENAANADALIPAVLTKILTYFGQHGVEGIYGKEDMTDKRLLAIINILDNLSPPTYVTGESSLWTIHVLFKIDLTIEHGLTPQGGYAFSELGLLFFILNQYDFAFPAAQLSRKIAQKFIKESPRHLSRVGHLYTNYNLPWMRPISETVALNDEFYQLSLEAGELIYAGYTSFFPYFNSYYQGKESLNTLINRLPEGLEFTKKIHHDLAHDSLWGLNLVLACLTGKTASENSFDLPEKSEQELLTYCQTVNDAFGSTVYNVLKGQALYLLGRLHEAQECLETAHALAGAMSGCVAIDTSFRLTYCLTLLALLPQADEQTKALYWTKIDQFSLQFTTWALHNPATFTHKKLLIDAEIARTRLENAVAVRNYAKAITSAEANGYERELALIHRLAADFWLGAGYPFYAKPHIETARYTFYRLDYTRVAETIDKKYESLFAAVDPNSDGATGPYYLKARNYLRTTVSENSSVLDIRSVLKAASALSEELVLDRLLDKMLRIVLENAGVQRAVLLVPNMGAWRVEAEQNLLTTNKSDFEPADLDNIKSLPATVINYAIRTQAEVFSSNTKLLKAFERDPYLKAQAPASYLCIPLIFKGDMVGILYLEHQTGYNAFTSTGLNLLRLLSSQMAASLANAILYRDQVALSRAYQRFVPHSFINALGRKNILQVELGDNIDQEMTVMFCDIRAYSSLSEGMTPEDNFRFINTYLKRVGPVIRANQGFINHYLGDGFIAVFKNNPEDALRAALQLSETIEQYNEKRLTDGRIPISVGMGIHTGRVMMGIIGDEERHDANVISDAVNISSRLEGLTKTFGSTILLSEKTMTGIINPGLFMFRFLGHIRVKGKEDALDVYEMISTNAPDLLEKKIQTLDLFKDGLNNYYKKRFGEAAVSLRKVLDINPADKTAYRYLLNAARYLVETPSEGWDGVETMTEK